jgi:hypothetical protein
MEGFERRGAVATRSTGVRRDTEAEGSLRCVAARPGERDEEGAATLVGMTVGCSWGDVWKHWTERRARVFRIGRASLLPAATESSVCARCTNLGQKAAEGSLRCVAARACLPRKLPLPGTFAQEEWDEEGAATSVGMALVAFGAMFGSTGPSAAGVAFVQIDRSSSTSYPRIFGSGQIRLEARALYRRMRVAPAS